MWISIGGWRFDLTVLPNRWTRDDRMNRYRAHSVNLLYLVSRALEMCAQGRCVQGRWGYGGVKKAGIH